MCPSSPTLIQSSKSFQQCQERGLVDSQWGSWGRVLAEPCPSILWHTLSLSFPAWETPFWFGGEGCLARAQDFLVRGVVVLLSQE